MSRFTDQDVTKAWALIERATDAELRRAHDLHGSPVMPPTTHFDQYHYAAKARQAKAIAAQAGATRFQVLMAEVYELGAAVPGSVNQLEEATQVIAGVIRLVAEQLHRESEVNE